MKAPKFPCCITSSRARVKKSRQHLKEGVDYYIEDGKRVYTETYLLKRGKCCYHGCRHCPYKKKKE